MKNEDNADISFVERVKIVLPKSEDMLEFIEHQIDLGSMVTKNISYKETRIVIQHNWTHTEVPKRATIEEPKVLICGVILYYCRTFSSAYCYILETWT